MLQETGTFPGSSVARRSGHDQCPALRKDSRDASLSDEAYERLKNAIIEFELTPGDSVSQSRLEHVYGFSRASIRSALTRLEQDELVRAIPRQGYIVSPITLSEIENVFDLRLLLEPYAASRAAARLTQEQIDALERLCTVNYCAMDRETLIPFLLANREFHVILSSSTGNDALTAFCERLHDQSLRMLYLAMTLDNQSTNWQHGHEEVLAALVARDAVKAADVLHREILGSKKSVTNAVRKSPVLAAQNLAPGPSEYRGLQKKNARVHEEEG